MIDNYDYFQKKMKNYPRSSMTMCQEYFDLFDHLITNKKNHKEKFTIRKYPFLIKHKYYKVFRDNLYFNFKNYLLFKLRKILKRNG